MTANPGVHKSNVSGTMEAIFDRMIAFAAEIARSADGGYSIG